MDYAGRLSERAEALQYGPQTDSLLLVQQQVIETCEQARLHADALYPWQRELHLNALINQAVAMNQSLEESASGKDAPEVYRQMTALLERALLVAGELPPESAYARQARARAEEYLAIVRGWQAETEKKPKN